ncbi:MAG: hypothetical protein QW842_05375 [Candidatus Nezhaarchaeales archaeon]
MSAGKLAAAVFRQSLLDACDRSLCRRCRAYAVAFLVGRPPVGYDIPVDDMTALLVVRAFWMEVLDADGKREWIFQDETAEISEDDRESVKVCKSCKARLVH